CPTACDPSVTELLIKVPLSNTPTRLNTPVLNTPFSERRNSNSVPMLSALSAFLNVKLRVPPDPAPGTKNISIGPVNDFWNTPTLTTSPRLGYISQRASRLQIVAVVSPGFPY